MKFRDVIDNLVGQEVRVFLIRGATLDGQIISAQEDFFFFTHSNPSKMPLPIPYAAVSNVEVDKLDKQ